MSKQGFLKGAVILTAAGIICRVLGVIFRIPLSNIVGNYGIGLYQLVFPLYSLLLILSSAGMPVAISKMIARVRDDKLKCKKILFNATLSMSIIGAVLTALFVALARNISAWQGNAEIWILYLAIAPSVFLVCFISSFRGYFQGMSNMVPTAVSQIIEQSVKVGVGLTLALVFIKKSIIWAVFGAVLAVSISELIAVIVLWIIYIIKEKPHKNKAPKAKMFSWEIIKNIFVISAPITIMSLSFPVVLMFDSFFIVNALKSTGVGNATELYGIASGAVHTLINLPTVVGLAIATVLVPMVSRFFKQNRTTEMKKKAMQSVWVTLGFSVLAGLILFLLPKFILNILYHRAFAGKPEELSIAVLLLKIESVAVVLICLTQVIGSILQGIDKSRWPMFALISGGVTKILFEIFFIKKIGIIAVSISNVLCFVVALIISSTVLIRFMCKRK